jgi:cysteinyl-tRNA synthetase
MSTELLGNTFDIHGGGLDLTFPHHENEIAQSCCADHTSGFARVWMHNGFLQTNNEKMSKSLGNFNFLRDVLQKYDGEVVRYVLMSAQYRQPLEFNFDLLDEAKKVLDRFYRAIEKNDVEPSQPTEAFMAALCDDLNTPMAFAELHRLVGEINKSEGSTHSLVAQLKACAQLIGLLYMKPTAWFQGSNNASDNDAIQSLIDQRIVARHAKDFAKADALRAELTALGIILDDNAEGTTWRRG